MSGRARKSRRRRNDDMPARNTKAGGKGNRASKRYAPKARKARKQDQDGVGSLNLGLEGGRGVGTLGLGLEDGGGVGTLGMELEGGGTPGAGVGTLGLGLEGSKKRKDEEEGLGTLGLGLEGSSGDQTGDLNLALE